MTTSTQSLTRSPTGRRLLNKVSEVTLYFWIIKVLATTVGEAAGTTATSIVFLTTILALVFYPRSHPPRPDTGPRARLMHPLPTSKAL